MTYDSVAISLLGPFKVMKGETPITQFDVDAARALLAYVVMHPDTIHPRLNLAALLWPELPENTGLRNLRQALNRLRHAIGDRDTETPFLKVTRKTLQINPKKAYWLDINEFNELISMTERHKHRHLDICRPCIQRLQYATDLYRGNFLEGFNFDSILFEEWLRTQRERLHRQMVQGLYHLALYHERRQEYEAMQRYAAWQIELEPWNEEAHRQLMRALAFSGRRTAALSQYEACRRTLENELNIEPIAETQALYEQIRAGEELQRFPSKVHHLPPQLTPLVGRENELGQIAEYLNGPDSRLLTLLGPGGIGKTRLAIQIAQEAVSAFRDGVYFIVLEAVDSPLYLPLALATALDISLHSISNPSTQLYNYLHNKDLLLVLDNFEQIPNGARQIAEILRQALEVKCLVTSRQRLNLAGEWVFRVQGLDYPLHKNQAALERFSAIQLFEQNARRVRPYFTLNHTTLPSVARICQIVEGVPLAIELAASWMATHTCQQIAHELQDSMKLLSSAQPDGTERHRSLRAVFDQTWALLTPKEQESLARLTVFRGSFDATSALQIVHTTPATITALADKSLLHLDTPDDPEGPMRYRIHKVLRQYAAEKLAGFFTLQDQIDIQESHSAYYMDFLHRQLPDLQGSAQIQALDTISLEIDNVRAAWKWAITHQTLERIQTAADSLSLFYEMRSYFREGQTVFSKAVAALVPPGQTLDQIWGNRKTLVGKLLAHQGKFTLLLGQQIDLDTLEESPSHPDLTFDSARSTLQQALEMTPENDHIGRASLLVQLGTFYEATGDYPEAARHYAQGLKLAQDTGATRWMVEALNGLSNVALHKCTYDIARTYAEDALNIARAAGDRSRIAATHANLATTAGQTGDLDIARTHAEKSLAAYEELGDKSGTAAALTKLGVIAQMEQDLRRAEDYYEESLAIHREIRDRWGIAISLNKLGGIAYLKKEYRNAQQHIEESLEIFTELGLVRDISHSLTDLGFIQLKTHTPDSTLPYFRQALKLAHDIAAPAEQAFALLGFAQHYRQTGQMEQSALLAGLLTHHPAAAQDINRLKELHTDLEAILPPKTLAECLERGSTLELEQTVETILAEQSAPTK